MLIQCALSAGPILHIVEDQVCEMGQGTQKCHRTGKDEKVGEGELLDAAAPQSECVVELAFEMDVEMEAEMDVVDAPWDADGGASRW